MLFSKISLFCLVAVVSARPQQLGPLYNDIESDYNDIEDETDPRFGFDPNPVYTYKYQVSDDTEQTYIAHDESRDGAAVTGQYSYVDPYGNLIVVKYTADDDGYRETREVQEGFISIRAKPKKEVKVAAPAPRPTPAPRRPAPETDSNLVARIIAQLTPFIKETVTNSLGAQTKEVQKTAPVAVPAVSKVSSDVFGADGENRILHESPHFSFDHILS